MTTWRTPARASFSSCQTIKDLPCTSSMGLGQVSVSGRMRSPRPAASISAWVTGGETGAMLMGEDYRAQGAWLPL